MDGCESPCIAAELLWSGASLALVFPGTVVEAGSANFAGIVACLSVMSRRNEKEGCELYMIGCGGGAIASAGTTKYIITITKPVLPIDQGGMGIDIQCGAWTVQHR